MPQEARREDCWALIAIKRRNQCKSRLTNLTSARRSQLVHLMLENVLDALRSSRCVGQIAVISPGSDEHRSDVLTLRDSGAGLNAALEIGRRQLVGLGARELVVLPADLPFLCAADVDHLVSAGRRAGSAIAPDAAGTGTNGLYLRAVSAFQFRFGPGSCAAHKAQSCTEGRPAPIVCTDGFAHDVDLAEDIAKLSLHPDERFRLVFERSRTETWLPTAHLV